MAKITIPDEPTIATFTVTASNDTFPIDFAIFAKADLRVMVGMTELAQGDFLFDGTLLEGGGYQGGTITLNTPVASTTVRIWRDLLPQRSENFGAVNSVPVAAVDLALSRQMAVSQDIKRDQEVVLQALPYLADLPNTVESVFDARDEALAATANKVDLDAANLSDPQKITFLDAIGAPLASEVATSLAGKINYAELSGGAAPAGGDARLRIKTNVEFFRTGDILDQFETDPGISNARALQAGIDALAAIGGGTIELPPGEFVLSNPFTSPTSLQRYAVEGKPWVRVDASAATLLPDDTIGAVFVFGTSVSSCDGFSVVDGFFDCTGLGDYDGFGGTGIFQRNGPRSQSVIFTGNYFLFPDVLPSDDRVPYHACVMNDAIGLWSGNITPRCGGDCYQFNGGYWGVLGNEVGECSDGAIAINNGFQGLVAGNVLRQSNLGIGGGPHALANENRERDITIRDNLIIAPNIAINFGWYSLWNRVSDGVDVADSSLTLTQKTNGTHVMKCPAKGVVIDGNTIIDPKSGGIWFIAGDNFDYALTVRDNEIVRTGSEENSQGLPLNDAASTINPIAIVGANRSVVQNNVVRDSVTPSGHPGIPAYLLSSCYEAVFDGNSSFGNAIDAKFQGGSTIFLGEFFTDGVPVIKDGTDDTPPTAGGYSIIPTIKYLGDKDFVARMIGGNPNIVTGNVSGDLRGYYYDRTDDSHHFFHSGGNNGFTSFSGGYTKRGLEAPRRSFGTEAGAQGGFTDPSTGGVSYGHGLASGKSRIIWCVITIDTGSGGPVVQVPAQWDDTNLGFPSSAYLNKAYTVQGEYSSIPVR